MGWMVVVVEYGEGPVEGGPVGSDVVWCEKSEVCYHERRFCGLGFRQLGGWDGTVHLKGHIYYFFF